jgi:hypothetical protein
VGSGRAVSSGERTSVEIAPAFTPSREISDLDHHFSKGGIILRRRVRKSLILHEGVKAGSKIKVGHLVPAFGELERGKFP